MRKVYKGGKAKEVYNRLTDNQKTFSWYGKPQMIKERQNIGGYWKEGDKWPCYDFTNGAEVFIEEVETKKKAKNYANGKAIKIGENKF